MARKKQPVSDLAFSSSPFDDADLLAALEDVFRRVCHVCGAGLDEPVVRCAGCGYPVREGDSERGGVDGAVLCCRCIAAIDAMLPEQ